MEFTHNGKTIMLKNNHGENYDLFLIRGNFIIKNIDKIETLNELIKLSHIFINYKLNKCIYNNELISKINNLSNYCLL